MWELQGPAGPRPLAHHKQAAWLPRDLPCAEVSVGPSPREASSLQVPETLVGLSLLRSCMQRQPVLTIHAAAPDVSALLGKACARPRCSLRLPWHHMQHEPALPVHAAAPGERAPACWLTTSQGLARGHGSSCQVGGGQPSQQLKGCMHLAASPCCLPSRWWAS